MNNARTELKSTRQGRRTKETSLFWAGGVRQNYDLICAFVYYSDHWLCSKISEKLLEFVRSF